MPLFRGDGFVMYPKSQGNEQEQATGCMGGKHSNRNTSRKAARCKPPEEEHPLPHYFSPWR